MSKNTVLFLLFAAFISGQELAGQTTNISGVINIYTSVSDVQCNSVTVASSAGFVFGERIERNGSISLVR